MTFREALIAAVLPQAMEWTMRQSDAELCALGLVKTGDERPHVIGRLAVMVADAVIAEAERRPLAPAVGPRLEGRCARMTGQPLSSNPYNEESNAEMADEWALGWREIESARDLQ